MSTVDVSVVCRTAYPGDWTDVATLPSFIKNKTRKKKKECNIEHWCQSKCCHFTVCFLKSTLFLVKLGCDNGIKTVLHLSCQVEAAISTVSYVIEGMKACFCKMSSVSLEWVSWCTSAQRKGGKSERVSDVDWGNGRTVNFRNTKIESV